MVKNLSIGVAEGDGEHILFDLLEVGLLDVY